MKILGKKNHPIFGEIDDVIFEHSDFDFSQKWSELNSETKANFLSWKKIPFLNSSNESVVEKMWDLGNGLKWNSNELMKEIKVALDFGNIKFNSFKIFPSGGDYDSESLRMSFPNNRTLFICGFNIDKQFSESNSYISYVEVTDGEDSSGGLTFDDGEIVLAYHIIRQFFKLKGCGIINVVTKMEDYF